MINFGVLIYFLIFENIMLSLVYVEFIRRNAKKSCIWIYQRRDSRKKWKEKGKQIKRKRSGCCKENPPAPIIQMRPIAEVKAYFLRPFGPTTPSSPCPRLQSVHGEARLHLFSYSSRVSTVLHPRFTMLFFFFYFLFIFLVYHLYSYY